jgi:hypothetical protein
VSLLFERAPRTVEAEAGVKRDFVTNPMQRGKHTNPKRKRGNHTNPKRERGTDKRATCGWFSLACASG